MTRDAGQHSTPRAPVVRHRPQHGPNALADYIQQSVDALKPPEPPNAAPPKRRKQPRRSQKPQPRDPAPPLQRHHGAVCVRNLLDPEELVDDDEYRDVMADLPSDFERFGAVAALRVDRASGDVTVEYSEATYVAACVAVMNGQKYGGRELVAAVLPLTDTEELVEEVAVAPSDAPLVGVLAAADNRNDLQPQQRRRRRSKIKSAVVQTRGRLNGAAANRTFVARNMVKADEVEDDDEYKDAKAEVTAALRRHGEVLTIQICREADDNNGGDRVQCVGDVVVEYAVEEIARAAFDALHDSKYGGRTLSCVWIPSPQVAHDAVVVVIVDGMLNADELQDDDEFADICEEAGAFFNSVLDVGDLKQISIARDTAQVTIRFEDQKEAQVAVATLGQKSYGGRQLIVQLQEPSGIRATRTSQPKDKPAALSVLAPAAQVSEELVALLTVFLQRLASLQERAHIQNPLQDKRSRRLVLGLHEVQRGVQSQKIKMLLLATDFDACDVLDDKLAEILAIATRERTPVIRALTRRKLGKILKKHARVSCVGVYSFDGANDQFRAILREHERLERAAKRTIPPGTAD